MSFTSHDEWRSLPDTGAMNKLTSCDLSQFLEESADRGGVLLHSPRPLIPARRQYRKTAPLGEVPWQALVLRATGERIEDRLEAVHTLARAGKQACLEALFYLREALGDPSEQVRVAAAEALALLGAEAPIDALVCALTDFSWKVRTAAAQALGYAGEQTPISSLVLLLKQERDENVREAIVRALGKRGHAMPVDVVTGILRQDRNWLVRTAAAWALGELREDAPVQPLLDALRRDQDESVRAAAAKALGKAGAQAVFELLLEALEDPEEEVREAAGWALQQLDAQTRNLTQWGSVYHFDEQLSPQAQAFFALTEFLSDKKGWVGQTNVLQTARGPVLHLTCFYQRATSLLQEAVLQLVKERCLLEPIDAALNGRDTAVQAVVQQALETRKRRPWLDLLVVSFALASPHDEPGHMTFRVIISGMGCQHVREQDTPVLDQLVSAWVNTVDEPPVCEHPHDLADLKIWYHPDPQYVPQLAAS